MATCTRCGRVEADPAPLTWSSVRTERGVELVCAECTRDNVRSIEGRLDEIWW